MKQQNIELLQTLYEEYQGALRYTATRIGVNIDDVDDVIQDSFCAFIKAYGDKIDQWEIARQKGAIMRILRNRCVDYFRIKSRRGMSISLDEGYYGREVSLPEPLIGKDVLDQMADEDEINYVTEYLKDMKPEWRDVAILHFIEERPITEVSQILGINEASLQNETYQTPKTFEKELSLQDLKEPGFLFHSLFRSTVTIQYLHSHEQKSIPDQLSLMGFLPVGQSFLTVSAASAQTY